MTSKTEPAAPAKSRAAPRASLGRRLAAWSALGVVAASVIAVCVNILGARFYARWDVTPAKLYTLSAPTRETLDGLAEPVDVIVFLSRSDPEIGAVERLLAQYRAASSWVRVRYVDPDRSPAEFLALQNQYRLVRGRAEEGKLVSDAAIVVARGDARAVISAEDMVTYDEERGTVQPRLEAAVTEALRQVLDPSTTEVCFSQGHEEPALEDGGPTGLAALRYALEKNSYRSREVNLAAAGSDLVLERCDLIVIAAPGAPFEAMAAARLTGLVHRGKNVLIGVGPTLGEDNRAAPSGLEPVLEVFGIQPRAQLIFERDPDLALPVGVAGEVFFALPKPHAITRGLLDNGQARFRVLLQLAQGFEAKGPAAPLLGTSGKAFAVGDASVLAKPGAPVEELTHDAEGPFVVAMAAQLEGPPPERRGARLVVLGSPSPLLGGTWQDPSLAGTRRFMESVVAWLVSRPRLLALEDKPERQVDLRFTEQSMREVARYVLIYMPATALCLGGIILYRRRAFRTGGSRRRGAA